MARSYRSLWPCACLLLLPVACGDDSGKGQTQPDPDTVSASDTGGVDAGADTAASDSTAGDTASDAGDTTSGTDTLGGACVPNVITCVSDTDVYQCDSFGKPRPTLTCPFGGTCTQLVGCEWGPEGGGIHTGTITVRVVTAQEDRGLVPPVEGALVLAGSDRTTAIRALTDANGTAVLTGLPAGEPQLITVAKAGFVTQSAAGITHELHNVLVSPTVSAATPPVGVQPTTYGGTVTHLDALMLLPEETAAARCISSTNGLAGNPPATWTDADGRFSLPTALGRRAIVCVGGGLSDDDRTASCTEDTQCLDGPCVDAVCKRFRPLRVGAVAGLVGYPGQEQTLLNVALSTPLDRRLALRPPADPRRAVVGPNLTFSDAYLSFGRDGYVALPGFTNSSSWWETIEIGPLPADLDALGARLTARVGGIGYGFASRPLTLTTGVGVVIPSNRVWRMTASALDALDAPIGRQAREAWTAPNGEHWFVGDGGLVVRVASGGVETQQTFTAADVLSVDGAAADDVWVGTSAGGLWHFDGTWTLAERFPYPVDRVRIYQGDPVVFTTGEVYRVGDTKTQLGFVFGVRAVLVDGDDQLLAADGSGVRRYDDDLDEWVHESDSEAISVVEALGLDQNGTAYAVGQAGVILRRLDGSWRRMDSPTKVTLRAVVRGPRGLMAFGDAGTVLRLDGSEWVIVNPASVAAVDLTVATASATELVSFGRATVDLGEHVEPPWLSDLPLHFDGALSYTWATPARGARTFERLVLNEETTEGQYWPRWFVNLPPGSGEVRLPDLACVDETLWGPFDHSLHVSTVRWHLPGVTWPFGSWRELSRAEAQGFADDIAAPPVFDAPGACCDEATNCSPYVDTACEQTTCPDGRCDRLQIVSEACCQPEVVASFDFDGNTTWTVVDAGVTRRDWHQRFGDERLSGEGALYFGDTATMSVDGPFRGTWSTESPPIDVPDTPVTLRLAMLQDLPPRPVHDVGVEILDLETGGRFVVWRGAHALPRGAWRSVTIPLLRRFADRQIRIGITVALGAHERDGRGVFIDDVVLRATCNDRSCGGDGDCDDGDPCTVDVCDEAAGCVHTEAACDDGDPCTADLCHAAGSCQHPALAGCQSE